MLREMAVRLRCPNPGVSAVYLVVLGHRGLQLDEQDGALQQAALNARLRDPVVGVAHDGDL